MRPDDQRFNAFTTHLTELDPKLNAFARGNGFAVEINAFHQPCRYLRRPGNPYWLIVTELDKDWRVSQIERDMEHTVIAIAYYVPPNEPAAVWRKADTIAKSVPFSDLVARIDEILAEAMKVLNELSGASIMRSGTRQENFQFKYWGIRE
jgi:hypothetical protein